MTDTPERTSNATHLQYHPVSNIFPLMQDAEFLDLKQDISEHGQLEPIWLHHDGSIIDGRNRYRACIDLGIEPKYRTWEGEGSLTAFVVGLNLHRRHLTSGQCAAIAVEILPMLEAEARERLREAAEKTHAMVSHKRDSATSDAPEPRQADDSCLAKKLARQAHESTAAAHAAKYAHTNRTYVAQAKALKDTAPDIFEKVRSGEVTLTQARREHVRRAAPKAPAMPSNKYRVIYADPPWEYGNAMPDYVTAPSDYYPAMSTRSICELPVRELADDNSVLFLWTTSPHLPEAFSVITAWGFDYKASFVWDKIKHNMGHYNSVRHEFLLVCTRGSCMPDNPQLFDSVQSIERTEHSVKPEEFRMIIDTIYPNGRRIELFARRPAEGWEVWGNESSS